MATNKEEKEALNKIIDALGKCDKGTQEKIIKAVAIFLDLEIDE